MKNPTRIEMVRQLKKTAVKEDSAIWNTIAADLDKVRKNRREVNLYKINKNTEKGDIVVVAGKVLGSGVLSHEVKVAAFKFSDGAIEKIKAAGGQAINLGDLMKSNPKGTGVKIIG